MAWVNSDGNNDDPGSEIKISYMLYMKDTESYILGHHEIKNFKSSV